MEQERKNIGLGHTVVTAPPEHDAGTCRKVGDLMSYLGDRWTLRTLVALGGGPRRFNQLRRDLEGVSQQMLARTLKALERDGMVTRTVHPSVPPQVEYALTDLGASLAEEGRRVGAWAFARIDEVDTHRDRFDKRDA